MQETLKICGIVTAVLAAILTTAAAHAQGVVSTTGQIQGISAPASVTRSGLKSNTMIMAFQERQAVTLPRPVSVNITQPGSYTLAKDNTLGTIAAGRVVNCCMLESNPVTDRVTFYNASITFDADILGLIVGTSRLNDTDRLLGVPSTVYPLHDPLRGLEQDGTRNTDSVSLSSDRRTVTVHFATGGAVDEIRVITAAP